jgi:coenzyme F420-reducing hydrogenase alpha subunit
MPRVRRRISMANEIERRFGARGIHANSLTPGGIVMSLYAQMPEGWNKSLG